MRVLLLVLIKMTQCMGRIKDESHIEAASTLRIIRSALLKGMLIICFILPPLKATAPGFSAGYIYVSQPIHVFEKLIQAVVMVESKGDTLAINLVEEAYGAFQIRPIRLLDYYQRTGKKYTTEDCFSFEISKEIFLYYAGGMKYPDYQIVARSWNGSGRMTLDYWRKIKKYL
jgi:hypothetical protein